METILIVDDDVETLNFLSEQLRSRGFEAATASSGGQAIEMVRAQHFELVICDMQMPLIDGIACMETLVNLDPSLHVIMMSGEATVDKAVAAMKKGAHDFLQKPLKMDELLFRIDKVLLKNQMNSMAQIYEKDHTLLSHLNTREWMEPMIKVIAHFFRAEQACWMTVETNTLSITGTHGLESDSARCAMLLLGERAVGERNKEKRPCLEGSAMLIPLVREDLTQAVLVLKRKPADEPFALSELREASRFADQILQTLDNSKLYHSFQERMSQLESVYRELEESKDLLHQQKKLAELGTQVAGVAHEMNGPLTAVMGYTNLVLNVPDLQPKLKQSLNVVHREALRCRDMVQDLLTYAKRRTPIFRWTHIQNIVNEALEAMAPELQRQAVKVRVEGNKEMPGVCADADQLRQVLINLMRNAIQAVHDRPLKEVDIRLNGDEECVRLELTDSGAGIPPENLQKIFEPYFSTHSSGQGCGLGLSICSDIIHEHHGKISVGNAEGRGAKFVIEIPRSQPDPLGQLRRAA